MKEEGNKAERNKTANEQSNIPGRSHCRII
jgi:hypothetical protein